MNRLILSLLTLGFLGISAFAADIPVKAQPITPSYTTPISWTGPWVGVLVGYSMKNQDTTIAGNDKFSTATISKGFFPGAIGLRPDGMTVGGRIGYDWQFAPRFVAGLMVDWSYSGMRGSAYAGGNLVGVSYSERITNIGDILGRAGYLVTDRALLYVVGGPTWATVKNNVSSAGLGTALGFTPAGSSSDTRWGWSIGGGLEYRLDRMWSLDLSYIYSDLGTQNTLVSATCGKSCVTTWTNSENVKFQRVMIGINARF